MPIPSFRPSNVIHATRLGFAGRATWPKAVIDPEMHYQKLAAVCHYVHETPDGYVLSDLGRREIAK
jgi:hypothetical protein